MPPFFSIITPTFNSLGALQRSLVSVLAQPTELLEFIIVDGASTDGTSEWLQQQPTSTCRWLSEPDTGVYDAMNKGIGMARGRFLYFLGAGDQLTPHILKDAFQFITSLPTDKPLFVYGDVRVMNETNRILGGHFSNHRLCQENISHQAIFYEKSIFDLLGPYNLKYPIYSDWAFNLRCFGDSRIAKHYWHSLIADFEGNGLSDRGRDVPFGEDRLSLIRQFLGPMVSFRFRLAQKWARIQNRIMGSQNRS